MLEKCWITVRHKAKKSKGNNFNKFLDFISMISLQCKIYTLVSKIQAQQSVPKPYNR